MALPSSGAISLSQVDTELGLSSTATIGLGCTNVRTLFGVSSGAISMSDGYGKSNCLRGCAVFTGAGGTYSWIVPCNVHSISVVAVGGGGGGACATNVPGNAPAGGLGYGNNISVNPGETYYIYVGAGGFGGGSNAFIYPPNATGVSCYACTYYAPQTNGQASGIFSNYYYASVQHSNYSVGSAIVQAMGGCSTGVYGASISYFAGAYYVNASRTSSRGGGRGGNPYGSSYYYCYSYGARNQLMTGGGAGAGGYSGTGGVNAIGDLTAFAAYGSMGSIGYCGSSGSGGGGGSGATFRWRNTTCSFNGGFNSVVKASNASGGGGVGLYGQGCNGGGGSADATMFSFGSSGGGGGSGGSAGGSGFKCRQSVYARCGLPTDAYYTAQFTPSQGGLFGGGGVAPGWGHGDFSAQYGFKSASFTSSRGYGGQGAVRIIYPGSRRSFPSTDTGT